MSNPYRPARLVIETQRKFASHFWPWFGLAGLLFFAGEALSQVAHGKWKLHVIAQFCFVMAFGVTFFAFYGRFSKKNIKNAKDTSERDQT